MFLRKNTASQTVCFGLVNSSTGAALAGATVTVRRCLDGTFAATTGSVTEDSGGLYKFAPSQADTNGDQVAYFFTATSAIPICLNARTTAADMADSVRFGLTALPNAAAAASGGLPTVGTGSGQISLSSGLVTLAAVTHTGAVIPTVTTVTNQLTAASIATGVWQDTTAGDFTVASSIGRSLYTTGALPGAAGGHFIAGTNAATTVTTSFTTTFTGNVTGSVGSVTGAVGSVTGNVGGNVTGSVGSVATGGITAASIAADAIGASELAADAVTEIATAVLDAFATASDSVQASPAPSTTQFAGSSSLSSTDSWYVGSVLVFTSGALDGLARKITSYTGATRLITVTSAWPTAPSSSDTFRILGRID
jgi:hypothetical protein